MKSLIWILIVLISCVSAIPAKTGKTVTWDTLYMLDYETGDMPEPIKSINNTLIEITGFIVPLEQGDDLDTVKEFLLVPDPLACIHVPPPPPNQIIYVIMKRSIPLDMDFRGVAITGTLSIPFAKAGEEFASYQLAGISAKAVEDDIQFDPSDPY